jgi:hypothetical protein
MFTEKARGRIRGVKNRESELSTEQEAVSIRGEVVVFETYREREWREIPVIGERREGRISWIKPGR